LLNSLRGVALGVGSIKVPYRRRWEDGLRGRWEDDLRGRRGVDLRG